MTHQRDIDKLLDHWFTDGPNSSPDRVLGIVVVTASSDNHSGPPGASHGGSPPCLQPSASPP